MSKLARVMAGSLVAAFFVAGVVTTSAVAQEKKAEKMEKSGADETDWKKNKPINSLSACKRLNLEFDAEKKLCFKREGARPLPNNRVARRVVAQNPRGTHVTTSAYKELKMSVGRYGIRASTKPADVSAASAIFPSLGLWAELFICPSVTSFTWATNTSA